MYGGILPGTGGLLNPLRVLYATVAVVVFVGGWLTGWLRDRRARRQQG